MGSIQEATKRESAGRGEQVHTRTHIHTQTLPPLPFLQPLMVLSTCDDGWHTPRDWASFTRDSRSLWATLLHMKMRVHVYLQLRSQ